MLSLALAITMLFERTSKQLKPLYITTESRDGRYSARGLLDRFQKKFPHLKILCIDAKTSRTPGHPALGFIEHINDKNAIRAIDVIICSPSIGSGVSIDVATTQGHFSAVFGLFKGVVPEWEARQALFRIREPIERHVWAATQGIGWVKGAIRLSNWKQIVKNITRNSKFGMIKAGLTVAKDDDWINGRFDAEHLCTWAKIAAEINSCMWHYREAMYAGLLGEGFEPSIISDAELLATRSQLMMISMGLHNLMCNRHLTPEESKLLQETDQQLEEVRSAIKANIAADSAIYGKMKASAQVRKEIIYNGIAQAKDLTEQEYKVSSGLTIKTDEQEWAETKYVLKQMYGVELTKELVKKHSADNFYSKLQRHFFLTKDPNKEWIKLRDRHQVNSQIEKGGLYFPDLKHLTLQILTLEWLGIHEWLQPGKETHKEDPRLLDVCSRWLKYSFDIKGILGVDITAHAPDKEGLGVKAPVVLLNRILDLVGVRYTFDKRVQLPDGTRRRNYTLKPKTLEDERVEIFPIWEYRWSEQYEKYLQELAAATQVSTCVELAVQPTPAEILMDALAHVTSVSQLRRAIAGYNEETISDAIFMQGRSRRQQMEEWLKIIQLEGNAPASEREALELGGS